MATASQDVAIEMAPSPAESSSRLVSEAPKRGGKVQRSVPVWMVIVVGILSVTTIVMTILFLISALHEDEDKVSTLGRLRVHAALSLFRCRAR